MHTPFAHARCLWLALFLLLFVVAASAQELQQRRMLKRRKPSPAAGPKDLALHECYEAGLAEHGHMLFTPDLFPLCTVLAPGQLVLYWKSPDNTSTAVPSNITFGVVAKRKGSGGGGWVALGFSEESQGMKGMDVALLRRRYGSETGIAVDKDTAATNPSSSAFVLEDRFSRDYTVPALDKVQNKMLMQATESRASTSSPSAGRVTSFVFSMPTSHCPDGHEEDISIVPGRRTFVMWAMGNEAPIGSGTSSSSSSSSSSRDSGDDNGVDEEAISIDRSGGGQELMYHGPTTRGSSALHLLATPEAFKKESAAVTVPSSGKKRDKAGKSKMLRVTLPRVSTPPERTHYQCMYAEVPQDRKYHVYQSKFLLNGTSVSSPSTSTSESSPSSSLPDGGDDPSAPLPSRLVHHAILYASSHNDTRGHKVGEPFDCTQELPITQGLPYLIASHASMTSPSDELWEEVDAALPLGLGYGKYVILEVHYDNPALLEGAVDSTGFELVLSPTLRTHDAGTLLVGSIPTTPEANITSPLIIPPGRARHDFVDYCPSTCTRKSLVRQPPLAFPPANGTSSSTGNATDAEAGNTSFSSSSFSSSSAPAHILYARLHMHTLGTSGEIQVIHNRSNSGSSSSSSGSSSSSSSSSGDGTEGEGLVRRRLVHRDYWDFNNQQGIGFSAPGVPFWPGDGILTRCTYNSLGQTRNVTWGEAATDEMCLGYIFYYPAPKTHAVACFDLNDARQPMLDKWKDWNHGEPLNVAACFPINEYTRAIASPQYSRAFVEKGMVVETPLGERGLKRTFNESAIWNPVCTNLTHGAGGGRGRG